MSRIIATAANEALTRHGAGGREACGAVARHGRDWGVEFPGTAYALPVILALMGKRVERLGDLEGFAGSPACCPRCPANTFGCPTWAGPRCRRGYPGGGGSH